MKASQIIDRVSAIVNEGFSRQSKRIKALEARIAALEGTKGMESGRVIRSSGQPHLAPPHKVGDIIRVAGGDDWRCVGPNRYRRIDA